MAKNIGDVVRAALENTVGGYVRTEPMLKASDDVETVHKARVAIRKLRSHLKTFEPVLEPVWARTLRERLRRLQDVLAPVRDGDVFAARIAELAKTLPSADAACAHEVVLALRERVRNQHAALHDALREDWYAPLVDDAIEAAHAPHLRSDEAARDAMHAILKRVYKKLRKAVKRAADTPSDRELHRIRIKTKHLRYAVEAFACTCGRAARRYARRVEALQMALGDLHDGAVAANRLRELAASPQARFASGELAVLVRGDATCPQWRRLWHDVERKKHRFW